jgi:hypothetical protein
MYKYTKQRAYLSTVTTAKDSKHHPCARNIPGYFSFSDR